MATKKPLKREAGKTKVFDAADTIPFSNIPIGKSSTTVPAGDDSRFIAQYHFYCNASSPADSTTYRFSVIPLIVLGTTDSLNNQIKSEFSGIITSMRINWNCTAGTNEGTTFRVKNLTTGVSFDFTTTQAIAGTGAVNFSGGTLSVSVDDMIQFIMITPVYATNPTSFTAAISITLKLT